MDAVIILILIFVIVFFVKKTFSGFIYSVGMIDILLRLIHFLNVNLFSGEIQAFFNKYFPISIPNMIGRYTNDILETVLVWAYVVIMIIFEFYIIRTFFHKK